jgi:hypothetical protein
MKCTNLASALLIDPTIKDKVAFAFIDGDFKNGRWGPGIYNWKNDIHAVQAIFESDVEYFHSTAMAVYYRVCGTDETRRVSAVCTRLLAPHTHRAGRLDVHRRNEADAGLFGARPRRNAGRRNSGQRTEIVAGGGIGKPCCKGHGTADRTAMKVTGQKPTVGSPRNGQRTHEHTDVDM